MVTEPHRRTLRVPTGIQTWNLYVPSTGEMLQQSGVPVGLLNHLLAMAADPFTHDVHPVNVTVCSFRLEATHAAR